MLRSLARILATAAFLCFFLPYCLVWWLGWGVYLFVLPALIFTLAALIASLAKGDRVALGLTVAGPALYVVPPLFVWAIERAGLAAEEQLAGTSMTPGLVMMRALAIVWGPALAIYVARFAFRSRFLPVSRRRLAWKLFLLGLPAWPMLPATVALLVCGFGLPSAGLFVFAPVVWMSIRAQRLAGAVCVREVAPWELERFAAHLLFVAFSTLAFSAFFSFALAANHGAGHEIALRAYEPLALYSFGAPFMALAAIWLAAALRLRSLRCAGAPPSRSDPEGRCSS